MITEHTVVVIALQGCGKICPQFSTMSLRIHKAKYSVFLLGYEPNKKFGLQSKISPSKEPIRWHKLR